MPFQRAFQRYLDLQQYVGWTARDAELILESRPIVARHFASIIDDFYAEIAKHPDAAKVIQGGDEQVARLKGTLRSWLEQLFAGVYDQEYVARRWQVGLRHVEIGLEQVYTNAALARIRQGLLHALCHNWSGERSQLLAMVEAVNRLLDLDLAIIEDAYRYEYSQRQKRIERFVTIGQMASGIAHELRNPLNVVRTSVYFLQNAKSPSAEKQAEHFERIQRQVTIAENVIAALRDYAVLPLPVFGPVQLSEVLDVVVAGLEMPEGIRVVKTFSPTAGDCWGDDRQLMLVFSNLIRNAIDAMPSGGEVTLGLSTESERLRVDVFDQGTGIAADEVHRVFEPFFSKKSRGMGLGLSIARAIVANHNGEIHVTSTPGQGSCFTVVLPAAPTTAERTDHAGQNS